MAELLNKDWESRRKEEGKSATECMHRNNKKKKFENWKKRKQSTTNERKKGRKARVYALKGKALK